MNWLLIAVLAVLVLTAFIGMKKGFLRMLFSAGALIFALIISIMIYPTAGGILCESTQLDEYLNEKYTSYIEEKLINDEDSFIIRIAESIADDSDEGILKLVSENIKAGAKKADTTANSISKELCLSLSKRLSSMTINVIAFLLTWIAMSIVMLLVLGLIRIIEKIPVIRGLNSLMGLALGILIGLLIIWLGFTIITATAASSFGNSCIKYISENSFLSWLYSINVFLKVL